jgi:hypothetical protein
MCIRSIRRNHRRRNEAIIMNRSLERLSHAKMLLLAGAGTAALAGPAGIGLLIGVGGAPVVHAQSTRQTFEVASIHKCGPNEVVPLREGGGLGDIGPSPKPGDPKLRHRYVTPPGCVRYLCGRSEAVPVFCPDAPHRESAGLDLFGPVHDRCKGRGRAGTAGDARAHDAVAARGQVPPETASREQKRPCV